MTLWNTEKSFFGALKWLNTGWYLIREIKRIYFNYFNSVQKRGFFLFSVECFEEERSGQNASAWLNRIQITSRYMLTKPAVFMNLTWWGLSKNTKFYWQWNQGSDKFWRCSGLKLRTFRAHCSFIRHVRALERMELWSRKKYCVKQCSGCLTWICFWGCLTLLTFYNCIVILVWKCIGT